MSVRKRTPRGTGEGRVQVAFLVSQDAKGKLNEMADAMALSQSQVMELALAAMQVDDTGLVWVGEVPLHVNESDNQGELPLSRTA